MSDKKNQHYVPKAHLRPFCQGGGEAINLYNIAGDFLKERAPIKGQCSKNFFYGKDGELETLLQSWEGNYARAVAKAAADAASIDEKDLKDLRDFAVLQTLRTFGNIEKSVKMFDHLRGDLLSAARNGGGKLSDEVKEITVEHAVLMAIGAFPEAAKSASDLDCCLVVNETAHEFITSDDPAIHTNRFHFQRLRQDAFGFTSAGAMLFLPLTPKRYFVAYDGGVYHMPERQGNVVTIRSVEEVASLNELQYLHARQNLYYSDSPTGERLIKEFKACAERRPATWHILKYLEKVGESAHGEHYKTASGLNLVPGRHILSAFHQVHVSPSRWPTTLRYRLKPKFVQTGTGAGCIRPTSSAFMEWQLDRALRPRKRRRFGPNPFARPRK